MCQLLNIQKDEKYIGSAFKELTLTERKKYMDSGNLNDVTRPVTETSTGTSEKFSEGGKGFWEVFHMT